MAYSWRGCVANAMPRYSAQFSALSSLSQCKSARVCLQRGKRLRKVFLVADKSKSLGDLLAWHDDCGKKCKCATACHERIGPGCSLQMQIQGGNPMRAFLLVSFVALVVAI